MNNGIANKDDRSWRKEKYRITEFDPDIITALVLKDWRYNRVQCKNCTHASEILGKTRLNCNMEEGEQYPDLYIVCGKYHAKAGTIKGDFQPFVKKIIFDNKLIKEFPIFPISYFPEVNKENIRCVDCRYHRVSTSLEIKSRSKEDGQNIVICSYTGLERYADNPRTCKRFETRNNNPWRGKKPNITNIRQEAKQPVVIQLLLPMASE